VLNTISHILPKIPYNVSIQTDRDVTDTRTSHTVSKFKVLVVMSEMVLLHVFHVLRKFGVM